jgi:ketosteroid isomerase-like protein
MKKYSNAFSILTVLTFLLIVTGCTSSSKSSDEEIKAVLTTEYKAHMEKNASMLVASLSDSFTSVDKGKISFPKNEETLKRFESYFGMVNFIKWDDIEPPVIRFSDDKSLAYALVRKQVVLEIKTKPGSRDTTNFAWTGIYRKEKDGWKLECIISTKE